MRDNQEAAAGDRLAEYQRTHAASQSGESFPTNAVVGVIDQPSEAVQAVDELIAAGFEPHVLGGEPGVEQIKDANGSASMVQRLFGYEARHTDRHIAELNAGHYVLLVESHDDETTDRIHKIFSEHGGHFVNYYSTWTSRTLAL